jgi:hypothetical protein
MMTTDGLMLSRSSFLRIPAVLNPNTIVYTPFMHGATEDWKIVDESFMNVSLTELQALIKQACDKETVWIWFKRKFGRN